jgi:cytochrome b561
LVVLSWLLGLVGDDLPRGAVRDAGLFVHISAGLAVIALLVMRLLWRTVDSPPPAEATPLGAWGDRLARITHVALYALLIAVPTAGMVLQFARGNALPVFGLFEVASPWAANRAFARSVSEVHELLAHTLIIIAALHAGAALVHHSVFRDRTLARMLPGAR